MAAAGDEAAQLSHALYERYYPNVYRYALSQLRSPQDAEDAAQNTFLRAFAALQKGIVPESEAAWLFKIAHNVCASSKLAWLRRRRVEMPRDLDEVHVAAAESDADVSGLNGALASMPPRLREAFLLREWQGLSYAEIAERLDTSHSAVETLIFRARRHLANELRRAQQALALGPLGAWLRGFFAGGGGIVRGAGLVAIAAAGAATATVVTPSGPKQAPARTGPQMVRAGILAPALPVVAQATSPARRRFVSTRAGALQAAPGSPAASPTAPAAPAPTAPGATVAATTSPQPATTPAAAPALRVPTAPAATVPATVSTPTVATPAVTVPSATVPSTTVPPVTVPPVTVPRVSTPVATTPALTTPSVTVPTTLP